MSFFSFNTPPPFSHTCLPVSVLSFVPFNSIRLVAESWDYTPHSCAVVLPTFLGCQCGFELETPPLNCHSASSWATKRTSEPVGHVIRLDLFILGLCHAIDIVDVSYNSLDTLKIIGPPSPGLRCRANAVLIIPCLPCLYAGITLVLHLCITFLRPHQTIEQCPCQDETSQSA